MNRSCMTKHNIKLTDHQPANISELDLTHDPQNQILNFLYLRITLQIKIRITKLFLRFPNSNKVLILQLDTTWLYFFLLNLSEFLAVLQR